jgi:hypothetical protein
MTQSDFPSLKEEVERKALETIEKIVSDRDHGRINESQYAYGVDLLWSLFAGVAGGDFMHMVEMMDASKKGCDQATRAYFLNRSKGVVARVKNFHDGLVTMNLIDKNGETEKLYDFRPEVGGVSRGKEKYQEICDALYKRGLDEI